MEFFHEAPLGAIILVVVGAILTLVISTPMKIRAGRRKAEREKAAKEMGAPSMITTDDGIRMAIVVDVAGWVLMALGFAIWIFA